MSAQLDAASVLTMDAGKSLQFAPAYRSDALFVELQNAIQRGVRQTLGVSPLALGGDLATLPLHALRALRDSDIAFASNLRDSFGESAALPFYRDWLRRVVLSGELRLTDAQAGVALDPSGWTGGFLSDSIEPNKRMAATAKLVADGILSKYTARRTLGFSPAREQRLIAHRATARRNG